MLAWLTSVALFAMVSTGTPGPNNLMILNSAANFGVRRSIPHWLGICTGVPVLMVAIGLGLYTLFEQWPVLFQVLKAAGVSYLLYLAWRIANAGAPSLKDAKARPMTFFEALLFQWVNPKAWTMCIGAITAFAHPSLPPLAQVPVLAGCFAIVGLACVFCWLSLGQQVAKLLQIKQHRQWFNWTMALLLVASLWPIVATSLTLPTS